MQAKNIATLTQARDIESRFTRHIMRPVDFPTDPTRGLRPRGIPLLFLFDIVTFFSIYNYFTITMTLMYTFLHFVHKNYTRFPLMHRS